VESANIERYKLLMESWRGQRSLSMQAFLGSAIATAILALISLGGSWWPHLLGLGYSVGWLAISAQMLSNQDRLYSQLEEMGSGNEDALFQTHRFAEAEINVPRVERAGAWAVKLSRYAMLGAPAILVVAWLAGFIGSIFS
jgi:hypothetical protein